MYYDEYGNPDPNGDFQKIDGNLCLRDGGRVHFNIDLMDRVAHTGRVFLTDAKSSEPTSIDELLKQRFATLAERDGTTVEGLLETLEQSEIEKMAAAAARDFISQTAGKGVAGHFGDSTMRITDAEITAFAASREGQGIRSLVMKQYQDRTRYLGDSATPFDPAEVDRALRDALATKKRNEGLYQDMRQDINQAGKAMRDLARDSQYL